MKKYSSFDELDALKAAFENGDVIAFPTDTVFGLACLYDDESAILKLKALKKRDAGKPLPMMCNSLEMLEQVAIVGADAKKIITRFTPGALTIVLNKRPEIPDYVTNGFSTIAIRIPNHKGILNLITKLGKPLLVTSANLSGNPSLKTYNSVLGELPDIDGIIMGDAKSTIASTIIDMSSGFKLLRQGIIQETELRQTLKEN